jgi:hypothetical protein
VTTYTWSGGTGPYNVVSTVGGVPQCSSSATTCDGPLQPAGYGVTLLDNAGHSETTTVTN